jgi:hypothetical protein
VIENVHYYIISDVESVVDMFVSPKKKKNTGMPSLKYNKSNHNFKFNCLIKFKINQKVLLAQLQNYKDFSVRNNHNFMFNRARYRK